MKAIKNNQKNELKPVRPEKPIEKDSARWYGCTSTNGTWLRDFDTCLCKK